MTTAALSSSEPDTNEQRPVPAIEKRLSRPTPQPRAKRPRAKKASAEQRREVERSRARALTTPKPPVQLGTLMIGAGIGSAITLSVVVLGSRGGRHSALGAAITKSVTYVIARTSSPGSLVNLLARAVGSALA
jgi:hypothetical protein